MQNKANLKGTCSYRVPLLMAGLPTRGCSPSAAPFLRVSLRLSFRRDRNSFRGNAAEVRGYETEAAKVRLENGRKLRLGRPR